MLVQKFGLSTELKSVNLKFIKKKPEYLWKDISASIVCIQFLFCTFEVSFDFVNYRCDYGYRRYPGAFYRVRTLDGVWGNIPVWGHA